MAVWNIYKRFLFWTRYIGEIEADTEEEAYAILNGEHYEKPKPKPKIVFKKPKVEIGETLLDETLLDTGWMIKVKKPDDTIFYRYYTKTEVSAIAHLLQK